MSIKYLQFISDCHLEYWKDTDIPIYQPTYPGNSYLALLGDIGHPYRHNYKNFISTHSQLFEHIIIISGNHEYYSTSNRQYTMDIVEQQIYDLAKEFPNVTYLQQETLLIDKTLFIGCTLWSNISDHNLVKSSMNDYSNIYLSSSYHTKPHRHVYPPTSVKPYQWIKPNHRLLDPNKVNQLNTDMTDWIFNTIDIYSQYDIIVLTHHAPSFNMLNKIDPLSQCYASNLDLEISQRPSIKYWLNGHTHTNTQTIIGSTICLSNCLGRLNENVPNFRPNYTIPFI